MDANATNSPLHRFSADRPLDKISEDKLGRHEFAERLAADILAWHGKDSLVISLNGAWGSGKTSLKNFIKECLNKRGVPIVVEFNPWAWSGQEKLIEGFFGSIRGQFSKTDQNAETDHLAARWESLESWTKLGAEISDQVAKALAPLFGGSVTVALLANSATAPWIRVLGVAIGILGVVVSTFFAIFPSIAARYIEAIKTNAGHSKRTLIQLREDITTELVKLRDKHRPVVVIIDDIDRLNTEETRLLFQLVKVNADFPNLVYLLLFQKTIVVDALADITADSGEEYLKKIVQVEFDVPFASRTSMLKIFQDGLHEILNRTEIKMRWDKERISELFEDDLWPYFRTLRDVKRFLGTFDFYFHGHANRGTLEVNPVDLLIIETLRTFDHETYLTIRDSLGYAIRGTLPRLLFGAEDRKKKVHVEVEAIINRPGLSESEKARLRSILRALFPEEDNGEFQAQAERNLRVCHPSHFGKYFEHNLDGSATSAASIQSLIKLVEQRDSFAARLRELSHSGEVEEVLKKLELYFDEIPSNLAVSFIGGFFDAGDEFPKPKLDMISRELTFLAARMIYQFLRRMPDNESRKQALVNALAGSPGLVVPVVTMGVLEPAKDKREPRPQLLEEPDLVPLRQDVLNRIKAQAAAGSIWKSRHFQLLLYRWREWAGQVEVNTWLGTAFDSPLRKLEFLAQMTSESVINGHRVEHYLNAKSLEDFVNLEEFQREIANVDVTGLNPLIALARKLLTRAIRLKAEGKSYAEVRERGDFEPEP